VLLDIVVFCRKSTQLIRNKLYWTCIIKNCKSSTKPQLLDIIKMLYWLLHDLLSTNPREV